MKILLLFIILYSSSFAQTITGRIVNQKNESLSGNQVKLYINPNVYTTTTNQDGTFTFNNIVYVKEETLPKDYSISNNFPNPFNPRTRINLSLPKTSQVKVELFNTLGQKVRNDIIRTFDAGNSHIILELKGLPNGIYIARINIDGRYSVTKKLMLLYGSQHLQDINSLVSAKLEKTSSTKIDSIVVSGDLFGKKIFANLQMMTGSSLDVGNLIVEMYAVTGYVYDLDTKFTNRTGIAGLNVYLGSSPTRKVQTDANGKFKIIATQKGIDSLIITSSDYYNWKNPSINVTGDIVVLPFNDTTGIPMIHRYVDPDNKEDLMDFTQMITNVTRNWLDDPIYKQTACRFKNKSVSVYLNRKNVPNSWYPDSVMSGFKHMENDQLHFIETTDSASAQMHMFYTNPNAGNGTNLQFANDELGPYLSGWDINIRGNKDYMGNESSPLQPIAVPYVIVHEGEHAIFASGEHSQYPQDIIYLDVFSRVSYFNFWDFGSEKEVRARKLIYYLERNPKLLWYYK